MRESSVLYDDGRLELSAPFDEVVRACLEAGWVALEYPQALIRLAFEEAAGEERWCYMIPEGLTEVKGFLVVKDGPGDWAWRDVLADWIAGIMDRWEAQRDALRRALAT